MSLWSYHEMLAFTYLQVYIYNQINVITNSLFEYWYIYFIYLIKDLTHVIKKILFLFNLRESYE